MTRRFASLLILLLLVALLITAIVNGLAGGAGASIAKPLKYNGRNYDGSVLQDGHGGGSNKVALIKVYGEITAGTSAANGSTAGGEDLIGEIRSIRRSGDYDGILLELDTPGGGVLPSAEVAHEVDLARKDGIKVVSWMRDVTASGGYYISAGTDRIVAAPQTITGSIGVIFEYLQFGELADKVGVKFTVVKSGKLKDIGSPFRDLTAEERALLQQLITESYDEFVKVVSTGRDIPEAKVRELADGRIYTGLQGIDNGLVDELGFRDTAYSAMAKLLKVDDGDDLKIVQYGPRVGLFEALTSASSTALTPHASATDVAAAVASGLAGGKGTPGASATGMATSNNGSPISLKYRAVL